MSVLKSYDHTIVGCYIGYVVQAIVNNFAPLLFITFQNSYGIELEKITMLITVNFGVQLLVDLLSAKFADKIGWRACMIAAHLFAALGLSGLAFLPELFQEEFYGLLISVMLYGIGGGLLEVCVSPIVEACPTKRKAAAMSLLHSFYCWGSVLVILVSSLYFMFRGTGDWKIMALIWAAVPALNLIYFLLVPMPVQSGEKASGSFKSLLGNGMFWLMALLMFCAGASELCISQWASGFAESGLNVTKAVGDIAGPCLFAFLMGISRLLFAKLSDKIKIEYILTCSCLLCAAGYLLIALSPDAVGALVGCGLCGLSVGALWPGTFSMSAAGIKGGGTMMFALLALAGDVGCTTGPTLVGLVTDALDGSLQTGLSFGIIFPLLMTIGLIVLVAVRKSKSKKLGVSLAPSREKERKKMIVSDLNSAGRYAEADKKIAACIDRARKMDAQTECGRYDVCRDVFVNVMEYEPKAAEDAVFETHELYADLQLILSGEEYMGYAALSDLSQKSEYDGEKDIAFWTGKAALLPLRAGEFAMFYPGEPHAPSLKKSAGKVKKAVFKIRYEKE